MSPKRFFNHVAVLVSGSSWFVPFAELLVQTLIKKGYKAKLCSSSEAVPKQTEVVFVLSYFEILSENFLARFPHTYVVHESALPKGRGWAPLFWQILEGKNQIPIVLFKVEKDVDRGDIFIKDKIVLKGTEIHEEIRFLQGYKTIEMCQNFLDNYQALKPRPQRGESTKFRRRTPEDSCLDINRSLKEQIHLLRIVNNEEFPAFFKYRNRKYIIKIYPHD